MKQIEKKGKIGFREASNGVKQTYQGLNFKIMISAGILTLILSAWIGLTLIEWSIITICITTVLFAEAINTAIEMICDYMNPTYDQKIGKIKDVAAGAVLLCCIGAVIIGTIIIGPYLYSLL